LLYLSTIDGYLTSQDQFPYSIKFNQILFLIVVISDGLMIFEHSFHKAVIFTYF